MERKSNFILLSFIAAMLSPISIFSQTSFEKQFSGIETMEIQGGSLEVSYVGSGTDNISLTAYLGPDEDSENDLVFVTLGNTLKVAYQPQHKRDRNFGGGQKRYVRIKGPVDMELQIINSSGSVKVVKVNSKETHLTVSSGSVEASMIEGDLYLRGSSGSFDVKEIAGSVTSTLSSGSMTIEKVQGGLDFSSSSGSLRASNIAGKLNAQLTSGSANLSEIGELGKLSISSGSIKATDAGLGNSTAFQGSSGSIFVSTPSDLNQFNFDLIASSGSLKVGDSSKAKRLEINNSARDTVTGKISSGSIKIEN